MEYRKIEDEFIGRTFGPRGQLEVTGWNGEREACQTKRYTVKCHTCSQDPELFGTATYLATKPNLLKGKLPCGCSSAPRWTEEQLQTRVHRECLNKGYEYMGPATPFLGVSTRVKLRCMRDSHVWEVRISSLLEGAGCRKCSNDLKKIPDEAMVASFNSTGAFPEGTTYTRVGEGADRRLWNITCPICSADKYVQAGLCYGVFASTSGSLQDGRSPCRCSPSYKWTREQREFQIAEIILQENLPYKMLGWDEPHVCEWDNRLSIECRNHGVWHPSVSNFINNGGRCPTCTGGGGFKPELPSSLYVLDAGKFTGFGISGKLKNRLRTHRKSLSEKDLTILRQQSFDMPGTTAIKLEATIKDNFPLYSQDIPGFITEATLPGKFDAVVAYAEDWLASSEHIVLHEP